MRAPALTLLMLLPACGAGVVDANLDAATAADDDLAQTAAASGAPTSWVGLYTTHATTHKEGDLTSLQLLAPAGTSTPGAYVRERCYHAGCALPLPETDAYDTYASTSGKTYVRFKSFTVSTDANGDRVSTPVVADVYEIASTSSGVKLRKSYSTRWFTLYRTTARARCTATGGTYASAACTCPSNEVFAPGAGGCFLGPSDSESNCDASSGLWSDDDATLTGAYCACGLGRYEDSTGTCSAI